MLTAGRLAPEDIQQLGWELRPEGLCQDDRCVRLPAEAVADDGSLDAEMVATSLGRPLLHDDRSAMMAIGPEAGHPALRSAQLPALTLHDFDRNPFNLAQLQGRKSLLVAWASW
jgi:hypothetical protein